MRGAARLVFGLLLPLLAAAQPSQPEAASGFAAKPAALAVHRMAVTANPYATEAALEILRRGGSAVDAAIAAQLVLNVVEPQSSGIGGGGFLLHWDARRQVVAAYDGRETAPQAATPQRFAGAAFRDVVATGKSVGTPGLVAMLAQAHAEHGRLPWRRLFVSASRLAQRGFPLSPRLHKLLRDDPFLRRDATARRLYYRPDGEPQPVGTLLRNPELAATFDRLARRGPQAFYRGPLAARMAATVQADGGDLAAADLAAYRARRREPVCGSYRLWRICGMPPPSSGGITVLQILGLLERLPFAVATPMSAEALHWFAEAGRLAFADRRRYLGDADFVAVPQAELLAPAYLDARSRLVEGERSLGVAPPGDLPQRDAFSDDLAAEIPATTHLSVVDGDGNAVALTSSIEDAFGRRRMVGGFLLNNQLTDFSFAPEEGGRPAANRVEPGKRPLSSMAPTLVFDADGRLYAVLGSPGGPRIINYVAQALVALLDWRLEPAQALALPHVGSRNGPTELEAGEFADEMKSRLAARGHELRVGDMTSGLHVIVRQAGGWSGAADPRREGSAAGD